jgi:hypothetical protein
MFDTADAPDPEQVLRRTCAMADIEAVPRERTLGLLPEWSEVLSGRPKPTKQ